MKENYKTNQEVNVIGGGSSLLGFDFDSLKNTNTICINRAIFDVPEPNYFITIDYTFFKKMTLEEFQRFQQERAFKIFIANMSDNEIVEKNNKFEDIKHHIKYELSVFDLVLRSFRKDGIGFSFSDFRSGVNSGYCGLQLAVLLGYKVINLLGFDLTCSQQTHYHTAYNSKPENFQTKLDIYLSFFRKGLEEIKQKDPSIQIYSCSPISSLNNQIPYKKIEDTYDH